ncbi:MAG: hypothetical protein WD426_04130 [Anditalea sp.]
MIKLLRYRAALLTVLFGLFGGALSQLLVIDEMTWYYTALASIIALVVNLLVSFLLKGRWSTRMKNHTKIASILLFLALIATIYAHTKYFIEGTFSYRGYDDQISYYVKGNEYTYVAQEFKKANPYIQSDADLIREGFGSPEEKYKAWTEQSINENKLGLISTYSLIIIFFVSLISILIEVLMGRYGKTTEKTFESFEDKKLKLKF